MQSYKENKDDMKVYVDSGTSTLKQYMSQHFSNSDRQKNIIDYSYFNKSCIEKDCYENLPTCGTKGKKFF